MSLHVVFTEFMLVHHIMYGMLLCEMHLKDQSKIILYMTLPPFDRSRKFFNLT